MNDTFYLDEEINEFDNFFKGKKRKSCEQKYIDQGRTKKQAKIQCKTDMGGGVLGRGVKKVGLSVPRGSFLLLVRLNYRGIASRIARAKNDQPTEYDRALRKWRTFGGSDKSLINSVNAGKGKKPLACGKNCRSKFDLPAKKKNFDGEDSSPYSADELEVMKMFPDIAYSNVEPATTSTGTIILTALPVLGGMVTALAGIKMSSDEKQANTISAQAELEAQKTAQILADKERQSQKGKYLAIGVITVIALTGIFLIVKKRRNKK